MRALASAGSIVEAMLTSIAVLQRAGGLSNFRATLLLAVLVAAPGVGVACQCLGDIEQNFKSSEHVLVAKVSAAKAFPLHFEVEFEATEILKGATPLSPIHVTGAPSLLCGMGHVAVGLKYVFFVDEVELKNDGRKSRASCHSFVIADPEASESLERLRNLSSPHVTVQRPRPECDKRSALDKALRHLRDIYTDEHADIIQVRAAIEDLRIRTEASNPGETLEEICAIE